MPYLTEGLISLGCATALGHPEDLPTELARQFERSRLERRPEEPRHDGGMERHSLRDDRRCQSQEASSDGRKQAHRHAIVHSYVELLRILQILEHDFAAL